MTEADIRRDAFWKLYQEHCTHMRHHEVQRATVAASMIAIAGALLGVATFDKALTFGDIPLLSMIFALGVFGALFSAKQHERSAMHMERARAYRDAIDAAFDDKPLKSLKATADATHNKDFPTLHRLRINKFWLGLYLFVVFIGLALMVVAIVWPIKSA